MDRWDRLNGGTGRARELRAPQRPTTRRRGGEGRGRLALTLSTALFLGFTVVFLAVVLDDPAPAIGEDVAILLLCAGMTLVGAATLPMAWSPGEPSEEDPEPGPQRLRRGPRRDWRRLAFWVACVAGSLAFLFAPLAPLVDGYAWGDMMGSGRRRMPLWLFAPLMWGCALAGLTGFVIWCARR